MVAKKKSPNYVLIDMIVSVILLLSSDHDSYPDWRAAVTEPKRFSNTSIVNELHWTSSVAVSVNGNTAPSFAPFELMANRWQTEWYKK